MSIIYLLFIFLVFYLLQSSLCKNFWNKNLEVEVKFKHGEIFEGENTGIIEVIKNSKWIPVWWLNVQIPMSRYVIFTEEEELKPRQKETIRIDFYTLFSNEKLTSNLNVTVFKRGYYRIEEFSISSGDLFSRYKFLENRRCRTSLCVYPRIINTPELNMFLNKLTGEIITKRHVIEDNFIFRGIRDYTIYDSQKLINWKASARSENMKVNQYDYTASEEILILLNTERFNEWDKEVLIEESIRLAATAAAHYIEKGIQVAVIANSRDVVTGQELYIKKSSGRAQLSSILEALAKLNEKSCTRDIKEIIDEEKEKISRLHTIILISYYYDKELINKFNEASEGGTQIEWILPKVKDEQLKIEPDYNLHIWEVSEDERRIY